LNGYRQLFEIIIALLDGVDVSADRSIRRFEEKHRFLNFHGHRIRDFE